MDIVTIKTLGSEASFVSERTRGLCAEQKQVCTTPGLSAGQRRLVAKTALPPNKAAVLTEPRCERCAGHWRCKMNSTSEVRNPTAHSQRKDK